MGPSFIPGIFSCFFLNVGNTVTVLCPCRQSPLIRRPVSESEAHAAARDLDSERSVWEIWREYRSTARKDPPGGPLVSIVEGSGSWGTSPGVDMQTLKPWPSNIEAKFGVESARPRSLN